LTPAVVGQVDGAYDRAAFVALPAPMRNDYAHKMIELLSPGQKLLLITFEYDQRAMDGPPFSVDENEISRLYAPSCRIDQLLFENVLDRETNFKSRGLTRLNEAVYRLSFK